MVNDDEDFDRDRIIRLYSNFESTVLLDGYLFIEDDPKLIEDIKFVSQELKYIAESLLDEIFA